MSLARLARDGRQLAEDQGLASDEPETCVWALWRDAACWISHGPDWRPRAPREPWPAFRHDAPENVIEEWRAELSARIDEVYEAPRARLSPTAEQISRTQAFHALAHTPRLFQIRQPDIALRALWRYAQHGRATKCGLPKATLYQRKRQCCATLARVIYGSEGRRAA